MSLIHKILDFLFPPRKVPIRVKISQEEKDRLLADALDKTDRR